MSSKPGHATLKRRRHHGGQDAPGELPHDTSSDKRLRTSHACNRCRAMRTKCSGGARCSKCVKDGAVCVYGDRKRERNKKSGPRCRLIELVILILGLRDLAESLDRIHALKEEQKQLLAALRSVTGSPDFDAQQHGDVLAILSKSVQAGTGGGTVSQAQLRRRRRPIATYKSILTHVKAMALPNLAGAMFWDGAYQEVSGQMVDGRNMTFAQVVRSVLD
ncbi:hypothetical protein ABEF95_001037 [Exophiala dermatitidis]